MQQKKKRLSGGFFIFFVAVIMLLSLDTGVKALEFKFGTLDLDTYTDWFGTSWGNINVVNTTGSSGSLPVPVDIINGELWFSLASDNSGSYATNYHLILSNPNYVYPDGVYDPLTLLNYTSYDTNSNTYTDGENVSNIGPGDSLVNLIQANDPFLCYTQTVLAPLLYIKDLRFTGQAQLNNFTFTDNGNTYVYNGPVDMSAENFTGGWYWISNNMSSSGSSVAITGDVPENQPPAPVPEPSTLALVGVGLLGILRKGRERWSQSAG